MKTLTSIQALALLAALGGAILVSTTSADAHGGGRSFRGHASFGHTTVHPIKHCIVKCSTTTTTTASHPVKPPCDFNCVKTTITPNGQIAVLHPTGMRRPGALSTVSTMSPGPGAVAPATQPAPVAPVATQPSAPTPVQPSCLRQAVTQDGQVVTFDICHNQAVVTPQAQTQTQTR
ncbi:MAG: hypothetical protein JO000_05470 [Alphaproteobacteria bacterium]|nr:hypothetical protein [Alphaproteobacteria bacterium]